MKKSILYVLIFLHLSVGYSKELKWLRVDNLNIVDSSGNKIMLKGIGINDSSYGEWIDPESSELFNNGDDPIISPEVIYDFELTDKDLLNLESMNINSVIYKLNYRYFEEKNQYKYNNLEKLKSDISRLNKRNIYVVLSLHIPPGLSPANSMFEDEKSGDNRLKTIFEDDLYWKKTVKFWSFISREFKDEPGIAGYKFFSEPRLAAKDDGGLDRLKQKYSEIYYEIRKIDKKHIFFIPCYESREANPGDVYGYWDNDQWIEVIDSGEQGIINEASFYGLEGKYQNIVYSMEFYEPWSMTAYGEGAYIFNDLEKYINSYLNWSKFVGKAPLVIDSFGITGYASSRVRLSWIKDVINIFEKHNISSFYISYKSVVGPWNNPLDSWSLYYEYLGIDEEIILLENGYKFASWAEFDANKSGFKFYFDDFFWISDELTDITSGDNNKILTILTKYNRSNN